ncbi:MAG TPA: hypothetical protein VIM42_09235 [Clostridium sp.]
MVYSKGKLFLKKGEIINMILIKEYASCNCEYRKLVKEDGTELLCGDYYDNINELIEGYLKALRDNKIEYDFSTRTIKCPECE